MLKQLFLTILIGLPVLSAVIYVIRWGGLYFYFYVWLLVLVVTLFLMTIYPNVIAPWFNKFTPVPEGELRTAVYELSSKLGFPLTQLYIVDGFTSISSFKCLFLWIF